MLIISNLLLNENFANNLKKLKHEKTKQKFVVYKHKQKFNFRIKKKIQLLQSSINNQTKVALQNISHFVKNKKQTNKQAKIF